MSFLDDTLCQICESFITKEDWTNHLYSNRHLQREAHGYLPAYFPQKILTGDENIIFEKAFWKMFFKPEILERWSSFG